MPRGRRGRSCGIAETESAVCMDEAQSLCSLSNGACKNEAFTIHRFASFDNGMLPFIQEIAVRNVFVVGRKTHRMDPAKPVALFDRSILCNVGISIVSLEQTTTARAPSESLLHSIHGTVNIFFKDKGIVIEHNHNEAPVIVDGIFFKHKASELTPDERSQILEISPFVTIGSLRRILRNRWPDIGFDSKLLSKLKAKGKQLTF